MRPTKADFDNAVQQNWNIRTCIIAQMLKRHGVSFGGSRGVFDHITTFEMSEARHIFDITFHRPADATKPRLVALRASLPDSDSD